MLLLASFFFFKSQNLIFIQKNKLKQNILEKKKVDNKFIINSSSCVYPPNESHFFILYKCFLFTCSAVTGTIHTYIHIYIYIYIYIYD